MSLFRRQTTTLEEDYRVVFGPDCGPASERVFRDLCEKFGHLTVTTVGADPYSTYFHEGQRDVFLYILNMAHRAGESRDRLVQVTEQENAA